MREWRYSSIVFFTRERPVYMSLMTSGRPASSEHLPADEFLSNYRERRAMEEVERIAQKRVDSAEQFSTLNGADVRIRAWEKVHQLRMPSAPSHPALAAIATATQLTLEDIQNEQRLRSARSAAAGV
jgi:hypothetical protein